jgi:hypothetical protein
MMMMTDCVLILTRWNDFLPSEVCIFGNNDHSNPERTTEVHLVLWLHNFITRLYIFILEINSILNRNEIDIFEVQRNNKIII